MKKLALFCLAGLALGGPAVAQPQQVAQVRFLTEPAGAAVYWGPRTRRHGQENVADGVSGPDPLVVHYRASVTNYPVRATLEGFDDLVGKVAVADLKGTEPLNVDLGTFHANSLRGWLRLHSLVIPACAGLAVLAGLGLANLFRLRKRQATLARRRLREVGAGDDAMVGKTVGRFHLLQLLGQGGMASVYRGTPLDSEREEDEVAVKLLHHYPEDEKSRERFYREVKICSALRHPRLVLLYEPLEDDGKVGLVMELIRGETLGELLYRDPQPPLAAVARIIGELVEGLTYAHGQGVIHRDLKPDNVMLGERGVKLMDFGIAQLTQAARITATGAAVGTLAYMAPEQIDGRELGPAVDQYALGMIVYEMLTGKPAFSDDSPTVLIMRRLQETLPPIRQVRPELSEELEAALLRMLDHDPQRRFASVEQAFSALRLGLR